jgi:hypothetical protein
MSKQNIYDNEEFFSSYEKLRIVNSLIKSGFVIDLINEAIPTEEIIKEHPDYADNIHKADFLVIRAKKI